ncbi:hypothetical protein PAMC26510_08380 [Caballeronia sordidicola]|uniref:Uncharacterized protein n=1 Tax=Caballeronia sordidicola TaxID=196367 RepID=A0A242N1Y0_CABSO|nr:hypothetical protein PAMC26510_08380 [Caballeronia sordidicola]
MISDFRHPRRGAFSIFAAPRRSTYRTSFSQADIAEAQ